MKCLFASMLNVAMKLELIDLAKTNELAQFACVNLPMIQTMIQNLITAAVYLIYTFSSA